MGTRSSYPPGTFSWVDLATTDAAAAKEFYTGLFGWEYEDVGATSSLCRLDGDVVAGIVEHPGAPHAWRSHVTVEDAGSVAARVARAGGRVVDDGIVQDPAGASFGLWQPRERIGAERVNDVGCLCMNELVTPDLEAAEAFYGEVFGWTVERTPGADGGPHMVFIDGAVNAAVFAAADGVPPHWRACFAVADVEAAVARVEALGGRRLGEPVALDHGAIGMGTDAQGALLSLFAGETDG